METCNFISQSVAVEKDRTVFCQRDIAIKNRACCVGYFATILRKNPGQDFLVQDYDSLPEYVLVNGVEFRKNDRVILFERPHRFVCAEYYRVDYEGRIKNLDGEWEDKDIIRPEYAVLLTREVHFHGTRMLTMKY